MEVWQRALQRTRGFAPLAAAAVTLIFSLPLGLFLSYLQHVQNDEALAQARLHATLHIRLLEQTLDQAREGARLVAEALPSRSQGQLQRLADSLLKINGSLTRIEVSQEGRALFTSDREHQDEAPVSSSLLRTGLETTPALAGEPKVSIRSDRIVASQALSVTPADSPRKFWGYSSVTIPLAKLVIASRLHELVAEGYGIRLRHIPDGDAPDALVFDSPAGTPGPSATQTLAIPGDGFLQLDVHSAPAGYTTLNIIVTWLFFTAGTVLFYLLTLHLLRRPAELEREVAMRTRQLDEEKLALQQEIASRAHAESLLERSHRLLDTIFEHLPGMIVLKRASDLRIARINRSGEEILGRSRDSLIGRCNEEIYPPELADRLSQTDRQAMQDSQPVELPLESIEMPGQPQRWARFRKIVLNDGSGRPEYILEFGEDITERERLDLRLREHLNFLEQLIDAIPGPLFFKDARGRYIGVNTAYEKFVGIHRAEIAGKTVFDIAPPQLAQVYHQADCDLLAAGGTQIYESKARHIDGTERHVMFHKAVFHATTGEAGGIVGIMLDITERKAAEEKLQLAARVFENSAEGIFVTDADNRILVVNKAFSAVTGYAPEEVIGNNPSLLSSGRQDASFYQEMWEALCTRGEWSGEIENRRKNGEIYPEWLNLSVVKGPEGKITNYVAIFSDLTRHKEIEEKLDFLTHYDSLTALPNRMAFQKRLGQSLSRARKKNQSLAVMVMDIDRFKLFNDSMGHGAGDRLLIEVANRLTGCVSASDSVCRLGGDEFAVIVTGLHSPGDVTARAGAIQQALRRTIAIEGHEIHLSASIGISLFPDDADSLEALIGNADAAMYSAIDAGGNTHRFFHQEMNSCAAERMRIEGKLHHALERGELAVYFQPLVSARTGRIVGAEALLRWRPQDGEDFIPPSTFVPLLEETGLIIPVGDWVMRTACEENRRWREATGRDLFVAVNLSAHQLADEGLVDKVWALVHGSGFDPRHLEIELTESAVMRDAEHGIRTLHRLKELGVSLSIDDFGTGYSSLSYLKQLPLDTLKIDRSFVTDAPGDPEAVSIIRAIVAMGHSMDFEIIAEGVETREQIDFLRQGTVDILQGYYFSKPVPAAEFLALVSASPAYELDGDDRERPVAAPIPFRPRARRQNSERT